MTEFLRVGRAALLLRCVRCGRGRVYRAPMRMHKACPVCGWQYEREDGYFFGAMYASWLFSMITVVPVMVLVVYTTWSIAITLSVTITQTIVQVPIAFMYSRVIWMAVDHLLDPFPPWEPMGAGEPGAARSQEMAVGRGDWPAGKPGNDA